MGRPTRRRCRHVVALTGVGRVGARRLCRSQTAVARHRLRGLVLAGVAGIAAVGRRVADGVATAHAAEAEPAPAADAEATAEVTRTPRGCPGPEPALAAV